MKKLMLPLLVILLGLPAGRVLAHVNFTNSNSAENSGEADGRILLAQGAGWQQQQMWRQQQQFQQQQQIQRQQQQLQQQRQIEQQRALQQQRQMEQQRLLQQQRQEQVRQQQQRQEQIRRQQEQNRQRQQEAARARQQQAEAQRQRQVEQQRQTERQRLSQDRQRLQGQRTQTDPRRAAEQQVRRNQELQLTLQRKRDQQVAEQRARRLQALRDGAARAARTPPTRSQSLTAMAGATAAAKADETRRRLQQAKSTTAKLREQRATGLRTTRPSAPTKQSNNKNAPLLNCPNGVCSTGTCSFHGDTLVLTRRGMVPIKDVREGEDDVWAQNEHTGEESWKRVLDQYFNIYEYIASITVFGSDGRQMLIRSNLIHPFYILEKSASSELEDNDILQNTIYPYFGELQSAIDKQRLERNVLHNAINNWKPLGYWKSASQLEAGDILMEPWGGIAIVATKYIYKETFIAFNLSVEDYSTYFVGNHHNSPGILVHNDCKKVTLPNDAQLKHIFRNDVGHLSNTENNRRRVLRLASEEKNFLGVDKFGNEVYAKTLKNGKQLWAYVRNGVLINGGLNNTPRNHSESMNLTRNRNEAE